MSSKSSFQIVFVPADYGEPIEERTITWGSEKEKVSCITDSLQAHFKKTTAEMSKEQKDKFLESVVEQARKNNPKLTLADVDPALLANFSGTQMVDIVALLIPNNANGFESISLYVDDGGSFKQSPQNRRATQLTQYCGRPTSVLGDAFIARQIDDGNDLFERKDFHAAEFNPKAAWIQQASAFQAAKADTPAATKQDLIRPNPARDKIQKLREEQAKAKAKAKPKISAEKAEAWFAKLQKWAADKLKQWDEDEEFRAERQKNFKSRDDYAKDLQAKFMKNFEKQTSHKAADYLGK